MITTQINGLRLATGIVSGVGDAWKLVRLPQTYNNMVVVATPSYNISRAGAVVRIRNANAGGSTFEIRVQNPKGDAANGYNVHYIVADAGVFNVDGVKVEAHRVESTIVDYKNSVVGQLFSTSQTYAQPVVLGQVMTNNDAWSQFWSITPENGSSNEISIGRHVGEDSNTTRANETLGVIIIEAGIYDVNGIQLEAGHTSDVVRGRENPIYAQTTSIAGLSVVASPASFDGADGGWPVLWGDAATGPFNSNGFNLLFDEDQIGDSEQRHTTEKIGYLVLNGEKDAVRFLAQAGFGGSFDDLHALAEQGYGAWIDAQKTLPISLTKPYIDNISRVQETYLASWVYTVGDPTVPSGLQIQNSYPFKWAFLNAGTESTNFSTAWMRNIVHQPDQLRQRVAWALSQIMVVSYKTDVGLQLSARSVASWYDMLATHALGNFRDLLLDVSLHPLMSYYLSSLGNQKASDDGSRQPDENYAREVMQLFSIGLWELNNDGSQQLQNGQPIPTYDNEDITELAKVFTGLWYSGQPFLSNGGLRERQNGTYRATNEPPQFALSDLTPLAMFEAYHDQGSKRLFHDKAWETTIPAGQSGMQDIEDAVDILFNHPNTPPFMARRLIQFMVMSNPPADYIERVANVFINNGNGVRGDMHATVRAMLLDREARAYRLNSRTYGKLQGPMVRLTRAIKAFRAGRDHQPDDFSDINNPVFNDLQFWREIGTDEFGQWPLYSNSVFNFFEPDYRHGGELVDNDGNPMFSPEFQILDPVTVTTTANEFAIMLEDGIQRIRTDLSPPFVFNFTDEVAIAADSAALIDRINTLLAGGQMRDETIAVIKQAVDQLPSSTESDRLKRVWVAVFGAFVSPECSTLS